MMHEGRVIESLEAVNILRDNIAGKTCIEVSIDGMFLLIAPSRILIFLSSNFVFM